MGWLFKMSVVELSGFSQQAAAAASFALHLTCALLGYGLSVRLLRLLGPWPDNDRLRGSCGLATAIVFVHPQRAEAVAWLSAQVNACAGAWELSRVVKELRCVPLRVTRLGCLLPLFLPLSRPPFFQGYPLATAFLLASAHLQLSAFLALVAAPAAPPRPPSSSSWQAASEARVDSVAAQLQAMGLGALSLACFSLGCLSKGAALSFAAFPAAVEFLLVTAPPASPPEKGCARKTAAAVLAVVARQLPALCVALFVARRTLAATAAQTTCGFANDYRKLGHQERWIAAAAAPLRHVARFVYPVDNAVEVG